MVFQKKNFTVDRMPPFNGGQLMDAAGRGIDLLKNGKLVVFDKDITDIVKSGFFGGMAWAFAEFLRKQNYREVNMAWDLGVPCEALGDDVGFVRVLLKLSKYQKVSPDLYHKTIKACDSLLFLERALREKDLGVGYQGSVEITILTADTYFQRAQKWLKLFIADVVKKLSIEHLIELTPVAKQVSQILHVHYKNILHIIKILKPSHLEKQLQEDLDKYPGW